MFNLFTWMFKNKDFKSHFLRLLSLILIFWVPAIVVQICMVLYGEQLPNTVFFYWKLVFIILLALPILCIMGYFWALTDNIINREIDISANNIYNKRIKINNKIELPEWNMLRLIWRGIASIVASVIMYIPFIYIVGTSYANVTNAANFWGWNASQTSAFINILIVFYCLYIPGMLWNYARRNSIVAVLNVPKVTYLMGNYPLRYIKHTFTFIAAYLLHAAIISYFTCNMGFAKYASSIEGYTVYSVSSNNLNLIFLTILLLLGCYIICLYFIYIYAYILGTLTPSNEN